MSMHKSPLFPTDLDWRIYGLDAATFGEPFIQSNGYDVAHDPFYGEWRLAHITLHYGDSRDFHRGGPWYRVTSTPHLGEWTLRELHSGLGQAGFVFGMSGTGHISGAPVPPERITMRLDDAPVQAEAWRGESAEVAWIETADTWITIRAAKAALAGACLRRIIDLSEVV